MNTKEELNQLIAEFMGYEFGVVNYYGQKDETEFQRKYEKVFDEIGLDSIGNYFFNPTTKDFFLKVEANNYRIKWDWLMPVVEKCYQIGNEKEKELDTVDSDLDDPKGWLSWNYRRVNLSTNINEVYEDVVEFIKWYNAQPKHL